MRAIRAVAPLALVALIAGCGTDQATSSSPPAATASPATPTATATPNTLSHAELVAKLNAICKAGNAKAAKLNAGDSASPTTWKAAASLYASGVRALSELNPSANDAEALKNYKTAMQRARGLAPRIEQATRNQDAAKLAVLEDALAANSKARLNAALDLGADSCGQ